MKGVISMARKLTEKQQLFVIEYVKDCNATQAAIRAGYSKKTAKSIATENLSKPYLKEAIRQLLDKMKKESIASADEVLQYLTSVMRGNQTDDVVITSPDKTQEIVKIHAPTRDRIQAANLLAKRYGLTTDNLHVDVEPVQIIDDLKDVDDNAT